jgi:hypothetical protein
MPLIDFLKEYAEALDDLKKEQKVMEDKQKAMRKGFSRRSRRRR